MLHLLQLHSNSSLVLTVTVTILSLLPFLPLQRENEDITFYVIKLLEKIELLLSPDNFKFK